MSTAQRSGNVDQSLRKVTLTSSQRAILASHRAFPNSGHQNPAILIQFDPGIDVEKLQAAFDNVVSKTDILRLKIPDPRSASAIIGLEPTSPSDTVCDTEASFIDWCRLRAQQSIDLDHGCFESVICLHPDDSVSWYINLHHIISDGTSIALIFDAVENAYRGNTVEAQDFFLQEAPSANGAAQNHWAKRCRATQIDRLYDYLNNCSAAAEHTQIRFDPSLTSVWDAALAGPYRLVMPGMAETAFLLATTAHYLHRLSGQSSFSIGVVINQRSQSQSQKIIGPVFDLFPVDLEIRPSDTHQDLFNRSAQALFTTLKYAKPNMAPPQDFAAVVNSLPNEVTRFEFASTPCKIIWLDANAIDGTHALRVMMAPYADIGDRNGYVPKMPSIRLDYNKTSLGNLPLERARTHMRRIVENALYDPDAPLTATLLEETTTDTPPYKPETPGTPASPDPIQIQLRKSLQGNHKVVISQDSRALTGDELWRWAVGIANFLNNHAHTTAEPKRVMIGLPPSIEAVAAIYGAVLSGTSFVPLDLGQPQSRVSELMRRANLTFSFDKADQVHALRPIDDSELDILTSEISEDDEAYLLFTSGSTGMPKGVPIPYSGLSAYVQHATERYFQAQQPTIAPLFGALTFDLTLTTLFAVPLASGRLVAFSESPVIALTTIAGHEDLNWLKATPSQLEVMLQYENCKAKFHTIVVGGEAFSGELARSLQKRFSNVRLINEYGPTETVVGCMEHTVTDEDLDQFADIPIGRAIRGTTLKIMDPLGQPVPKGAIGELWISHAGITRGYLDGDTNPLAHDSGREFYRSGDLVRQDEQSIYHYVGRCDAQIKLKGIRLDPSEIQTAALSHPKVDRAVAGIWSPNKRPIAQRCSLCGLPDNIPGVTFDEMGRCSTCEAFSEVKSSANEWFKSPDDLRNLLQNKRDSIKTVYDCMHLLSGGKDSTFALYKLVELGATPFVLTLDNGYISDEAKMNIDRVISDLGLAHEYVSPQNMTDIFRESLQKFSNVCNGCYKSLYVMATARADALGIPIIVTGLSRGQLFETRLVPGQFRSNRFDPQAIETAVLAARKVYHSASDACSKLPQAQVFTDQTVFQRIEYVDFYRYVDVSLSSLLEFLQDKTPWQRPSDTGRSTNCLINDAGIFTHIAEQGYHNYAIPYAWDVRLGHKTRDDAIAELEDALDQEDVLKKLSDIGHQISPRSTLSLWYTGGTDAPSNTELQSHLASRLPGYAIPQSYLKVKEIPLTSNGKIDLTSLPQPSRAIRPRTDFLIAATDPLERRIITLWEEQLKIAPIDRTDDFFGLGGDSLAALTMIVNLGHEMNVTLSDGLAFTTRTPAQLAVAVKQASQLAKNATDTEQHAAAPMWSATNPPPITTAEASLLYEQKLDSDSVRFNTTQVFHVDKPLSPDRLRDAFTQVALLHIPLSWTYTSPRKPISRSGIVDFQTLPSGPDIENARACFAKHSAKKFDLEDGPLLRVRFQALTDGTSAVSVTMHHVACDHESFPILWQQVIETYTGVRDNSELPTDYPTFLKSLSRGQEDQAREYWREHDFAEPGQLLDCGKPLFSEQDGLITIELPLSSKLLKNGHSSPLSARMALAADCAFRPYVAGGPVTMCLLTSPRARKAAENLVGYFLNPLPLQFTHPDEIPSQDALDLVTQHISNALAQPYLHFGDIVSERVLAKRTIPKPHVFLSVFDDNTLDFGGIHSSYSALHESQAVSDATIFVSTEPSGTYVSIEYRRDTYSDNVAQDILERFKSALITLQQGDICTIGDLLRDTESILDGGPGVEGELMPIQISNNLHQLGTKPAVECDGKIYSYADLASRVAQIEDVLRDAAVQTDSKVAIALPRGLNYVAAILATHRLRAAYVPLDISNSEERQNRVLSGSKPVVVLHDGSYHEIQHAEIVITSDGIEGIAWEPRTLGPTADICKDDTAYVIFTSGTTAKPKGVAISQSQLAASTHARRNVYDTSPRRFAMLSSFAFDSSIVGLFWTLSQGGTLLLPTESQAHAPEEISKLISDDRITHTLTVPTLYNALLDQKIRLSLSEWPKHVILAGEEFAKSLLSKHFRTCLNRTLLTNEYGPTEATVWTLSRHLSTNDGEIAAGKPIPGTWVAIIQPNGHPCPWGTIGEIVIGGSQIASGYLSKTEHENHQFDTCTTPSHFGEKIYRTGDLGYMHDGQVFFVGRIGSQLNIGGLRVDVGEIEGLLTSIAGIDEAVVVAQDTRSLAQLLERATASDLQDAFGQSALSDQPSAHLRMLLTAALPAPTSLIAHLATYEAISENNIREEISKKLPAALIPSHIIQHRNLPLSPNGKIDRNSLIFSSSKTDIQLTAQEHCPSEEADNETLTRLSTLFAQELGNTGFQIDDNFFEFGGHSLSALQLILQIEQEFDVSPSTADIYLAPTPRLLANQIGLSSPQEASVLTNKVKKSRVRGKSGLILPLQINGDRPPIIALHSLGVNGSHFRPLSAALGPDQPFWCIGEARSPTMYDNWVGDPETATSVEDVALEYVEEIQKLFPSGPIILAGSCLGAVYAYEVAQQLTTSGREPLLFYVERDTHAPEMEAGGQTIFRHSIQKEANLLKSLNVRQTLKRVPRIPKIAARWSKRIRGEIARSFELRALEQAKAGKRKFTDKLAIRDFIESSYLSVHDYDYRPYSGNVEIIRDSNEKSYPDPSKNNAYGNRLSNAVVNWLPELQLGPEIVAQKRAEILRSRIDTLISAQAARPNLDTAPRQDSSLSKNHETQTFVRSTNHFRATVNLNGDHVIRTPRTEQRQWLVGERLRELSNELEHLDSVAPHMISASGSLTIDGRETAPLSPDEIMEDWQIPLMQAMAEISARSGGDVLEVGYGRGISSRMIQGHSPRSHTIIECNPTLVADAKQWRDANPNSDIRIVQGYWQDVIKDLGQFDGILFHTYPLSTEELAEVLAKHSTFAENFFSDASRLLRPNGRFTYFTNDADSLSRGHQRALLQYFSSYKICQICNLDIPENSADAHWFDRIVAIEATA